MLKAKGRQPSREAILDAAVTEFAARGYDGVRIEHVARRSGFNKTLVYRHFSDKGNLFRECLRHQFQRRETMLMEIPGALSDALVWWSRQQREDRDFVRLILREALADSGAEPVDAKRRRAYYKRQVEQIRKLQKEGDIDATLDSEMLFFAMLTLTVAPVVLPQIARLIAAAPPRAFATRWDRFLQELAAKLE